jgi:hypothetical protein
MVSAEVRQHVDARLTRSQEFLDIAELLENEESRNALVSLCVTAGINAADAVVSAHERAVDANRNHDQAPRVLRQLGLDSMAAALSRLLGLKNKAQYSVRPCTAADVAAALYSARKMLELATTECDRRRTL